MNDLENIFRNHSGRLIHKWTHYFEIYDRYFSKYRNTPVIILEIGVSQGGSLQMWKSYFGKNAVIYGVDIDPRCKDLEEENVHIFIGSQSDRKFLRTLKSSIPKVDILIDDGGHTMPQQIITFKELYDHVKDDGIYLCEDTHTSYWHRYGGGVRRFSSFMEYSKRLIDDLHAFHSEQWSLKPSAFTTSAQAVHFYDSIVVIEKKKRSAPTHEKSGNLSFEKSPEAKSAFNSAIYSIKLSIVAAINKTLRFLRIPFFIWK
jgi:hypothetical protein